MPGLKRSRSRCADASRAGNVSSPQPNNWHAASREIVPVPPTSNPPDMERAYWDKGAIILWPQPDTHSGPGNDHSRGNVFFAYFADSSRTLRSKALDRQIAENGRKATIADSRHYIRTG